MAGSRQIRGITIQFGADTSKFNQALSEVNNKAKGVTKELRDTNKLLKFNPGNIELTRQKQDQLKKAIENTNDKLKTLKDLQANMKAQGIDENSSQYQALRREIIETEERLKSLNKEARSTNGITAFGDKMKGVGDKLKGVGASITSIGQDLSLKVTAPIVALGTVAVKAASDYESAFAGVRKTTDMTEQQYAKLSEGIRQISKEMPATASEIAGVAEAAGQLGIQNENILEFSRSMIQMGQATNMTAEEASTSFARFANIMQMPQDKMSQLGSTVVALGNNFATTEGEIVSMGMRLAGTGNQIGLSVTDVMGLATAMSSVGIEAEAGGTAMSMVMKKIHNAVSAGGEDLQDFAKVSGMSAKEFGELWKEEPMYAINDFVLGLAKVQNEGGNVNNTLSALGIKGIRETDTLLRLSGASHLLADAFIMADDAFVENIALMDEAAQRNETLESKIQMMKNTLTDLAITFGNDIMPTVEKAVGKIGELVNKFSELDPATRESIIKFAALAAAIGPVVVVIGTVIGAIGKIITVGGALVSAIGTVVGILGGPLTIAIGAVIALGVLLYKNWDTVKNDFIKLWGIIKTSVTNIITSMSEKIKVVWDGIKAYFTTVLNVYKTIFTTVFNAIKTTVTTVVNTVKTTITNVWDSIKTTTTNIFNGVKTAITNPITAAKNTVLSTFDSIKNGISNKITAAKNTVTSMIDKIKSAFDFTWSLPKIKLPKINVWTEKGLLGLPIPKFSVSWNRDGGIFKRPTVLPTLQGLQGFAEPSTGGEAIMPLNKLPELMAEAIDRSQSSRGQTIVNYITLDGKVIAKEVTDTVDYNLGRKATRQRLAGGLV